jgi:hypothetical protein
MTTNLPVTGAARTDSRPQHRRRRALVAILTVAFVIAACGGSEDVVAEEPVNVPGEPIEVVGRPGLVFHDVSPAGTLVFPQTDPRNQPGQADADALSAAALAISSWLNTVLTERNRGETTTVARSEVDARSFAAAIGIDGTPAGELPELQVVTATYLIELAHLGTPGWAIARVDSQLVALDAPDTPLSRRLDTFVFSIDAAGTLEFLALEVGP